MKTFMNILIAGVIALTALQPTAFAGTATTTVAATTIAKTMPVNLIKAQLLDNHFFYTLKGEIDITNLAFKKQVTVIWDGRATGGRVDATYKMPLEKGHELWTFKTNINKADLGVGGITLNIRYKVGGKTFFDTNGDDEYLLTPENFTMVLGDRLLANEDATFDWTENAVNGTVIVKPGYPLAIKIVYTTDHWATKNFAYAGYQETLGEGIKANNLERWTFRLPVDEKTKNVEYAIARTENGKATWDNNNLMNYHEAR